MTNLIDKKAFPEGILKGEWDVTDGVGSVNMKELTLSVPLGTAKHKQHVRNHEYCHIRFSPMDLGELRSENDLAAVRAFEDCRVNILGARSKVKLSKAVTKEALEKSKEITDRFIRLSLTISTYKYDAYKPLKSELSPLDSKMVRHFVKRIKKDADDFEKVKTLAYEFVDMFSPPKPKDDIRSEIEEEVKKDKAKRKGADEEESEEEEESERVKPKRKRRSAGKSRYSYPAAKKFPDYKSAIGRCGEMFIQQYPLTVKNVWRKNKRSDTGFIFRHPDRVLTDMYCFEELRKAPFRGTILVDCSGSMSIDDKVLQSLVKEGCGCTVAGYCGRGRIGTLHILSENGHTIKDIPKFEDGNIIDLPALLWLGTKKGEKIWVSDGVATGIGDVEHYNIKRECFRLTAQKNIKNVPTLESAIELIKKIKTKRR